MSLRSLRTPSSRALRFAAIFFLLAATSIAFQSCRAAQRGLGRDAILRQLADLSQGTPRRLNREQAIALRLPTSSLPLPVANAEDNLQLAQSAFAHGDLVRARKLRRTLSAEDEGALVHACAAARIVDAADEVVASCSRALDVIADPEVGLGLLGALWAARVERVEVFNIVTTRAKKWRNRCAPSRSCAAFSSSLAQMELEVAIRRQDATATRDSLARTGRLFSGSIAGPYQGEAVSELWRFPNSLTPRRQRFTTTSRESWDGVHYPSRRNEPGLYRLSFHVKAAGAGYLFVESRQRVRTFVDGVEVMASSNGRTSAQPINVELTPGTHSIELAVAAVGFSNGVTVSLLDARGRPMAVDRNPTTKVNGRLLSSSPHVSTPKASDTMAPTFAELDRLVLRADAISFGHARGPIVLDVVHSLLGRFGDSVQAGVVAARLLSWGDAGQTTRTQAKVREFFSAIRQRWPSHVDALLHHIDEASAERPAEALVRARAAILAQPNSVRIAHRLATLSLYANAVGEALNAARHGLKISGTPDMLDAAILVLDDANAFVEVAALQERRAMSPFPADDDRVARLFLRQGKTQEALDILGTLSERFPGHAAEELRLQLLEIRSPDDALSALAKLRKEFPNDRTLGSRHIGQLVSTGKRAGARSLANKLVEQFGADNELEAWLLDLGAPDPLAPDLARGEEIARAFFEREVSPFEGKTGGFVFDAMRVVFAIDGGRVTTRHQLYEVRTKAAIDAWGEVGLSPDGRLARLIVRRRDGTISQPERHDDLGTASLVGLSPGDVVEILRVSYAPASVDWDKDEVAFSFATAAGAIERRLEILTRVDAGKVGLTITSLNQAPTVVEDELIDTVSRRPFRRSRFVAHDVAALSPEPFAADVATDLPLVLVTRALDLPSVSTRKFRAFSGAPLSKGPGANAWLDAVATRVTADADDGEKFAALFSFVVREIESGTTTSGELALLTGEGDRTALLFDLACRAGLEAQLVAVHLPVTGDENLVSSSRFGLDGILVRRASGDPQFAFVSGGAAVLNALPASSTATYFVTSMNDVPTMLLLPKTAMAAPPVEIHVAMTATSASSKRSTTSISPAGKLSETRTGFDGVMSLRIPPHRAYGLREALQKADDVSRRGAFEGALGSSFPGVVVNNVRLPNVDDDGAPLGVGVEFFVPAKAGDVVEWGEVFHLGAAATLGISVALSAYLQVPKRKRSMVVLPGEELLRLQIDLGNGGTFTEVPVSFSNTAGLVEVQQQASVSDGRLDLQRKISMRAGYVDTEEYSVLRPDWVAIAQRLKLRVSFLLAERAE